MHHIPAYPSSSTRMNDIESVPTGGMGAAPKSGAPIPALSVLSPSSWLNFLQALFDVSTNEIVERLVAAATPLRLLRGSSESSLQSKPDLYGPFWIATTAIITMTGAANIERLFIEGHTGADYSLLWTAAWFLYGCLAAVPVIAYAFTWFTKHEEGTDLSTASSVSVDYTHLVSVYGYSNLSLIPVTMVCIVPIEMLHTVVLAVGAANSALFIYASLWRLMATAPARLRLVTVAAAMGCQAATYLAFYHVFLRW